MLIGQIKPDFDEHLIVFVHIPKTGGSSLIQIARETWGKDAVVRARNQRFDKIFRSRLHKGHTIAREWWSQMRYAAKGSHWLLPRDFDPATAGRIKLIGGHMRLGAEPTFGKCPLYVSLFRDPVDRFISDYYFLRSIAQRDRDGLRRTKPSTLAMFEGVESYAEVLLKNRQSWNTQCQYLTPEGTFDAARKMVDETVFLAAPLPRFDDFFKLLANEVGLPTPEATDPRNVGKARPEKPELSPRTEEILHQILEEDQKLYTYVTKAFDAVIPTQNTQ